MRGYYPLYACAALKNSSQQVGVNKVLLYDDANGAYGSLELQDGVVEFRDVGGSVISFGGGSGDMVLASAQTVTGAKTFRDATLLLRNVANTFSAQFTNTNTAARTYTLPDAAGTIALTSDLSSYQPLDSDLTSIAALATTSFGRSLLTQADAAATRSTIGAISSITVREIDGTPSIAATILEFSNGHVTDMGGGVARVSITGGGGGSTPVDITVANEATDTTCFVAFFTAATGDLGPKTNASLTYNSATSSLACTTFLGALTGNASTVTTNANLTGHVTSVGNAAVLGSFTKAQLDAAVSDGNVLYVGDPPTAHNQAWSTITSTPTTLSGYGITDAIALTSGSLDQFADVTQTAGQTLSITSSTTLSGGTHSGTNTGDNATNTQYSGLVSNATHTGDVTGATALTIKTDVALAGNPTTTTQAATDNSTRIATTAHVKTAIPAQFQIAIDTTTTGFKAPFYRVPYACTITGWELVSGNGVSGSVVLDLWKDTYPNYEPTDGDSITGSALPTLSASNKAQSTTLTGWTTTLSAGDYIGANVDSRTTVTIVVLTLLLTRT